jgi:hypothetical protein
MDFTSTIEIPFYLIFGLIFHLFSTKAGISFGKRNFEGSRTREVYVKNRIREFQYEAQI